MNKKQRSMQSRRNLYTNPGEHNLLVRLNKCEEKKIIDYYENFGIRFT